LSERENIDLFNAMQKKSVKPGLEVGAWPVWERYDVVEVDEGADSYLLAPQDATYEWFYPLRLPSLFLEFARLADQREITREVWLDWAHRYGVLGLTLRDQSNLIQVALFGHVREEGGPKESFKEFVREAKEANRLLRLCESYASPEGPDRSRFLKEASEIHGFRLPSGRVRMTPDDSREWALGVVLNQVQYHLQNCYPVIVPVAGGFAQGWAFHTLLSGMYLQMMWLLTAFTGEEDDVHWCKRPECTRVITYKQPEQPKGVVTQKNDRSGGYKTRRDKEFCSDRCRGLYHYHYVKKPKGRR
jgi:hypothetical protein